MAKLTPDKIRGKSRQAMLEMAEGWDKQGKIQHAIEAYEKVIGMGKGSKEADKARDALLKIAKKFEKEGKECSAYYLYQKVGYGKAGRSKRSA